MASLDLAAGFAGSSAEFKAKIGPALICLGLVVILGLAFIVRHSFNQHPRDEDWTNPHQPDTNVDVPLFFGADGDHDKPSVDCGMRERHYPPSLHEDPNSIIGRC